jgi:hypothetical protein
MLGNWACSAATNTSASWSCMCCSPWIRGVAGLSVLQFEMGRSMHAQPSAQAWGALK